MLSISLNKLLPLAFNALLSRSVTSECNYTTMAYFITNLLSQLPYVELNKYSPIIGDHGRCLKNCPLIGPGGFLGQNWAAKSRLRINFGLSKARFKKNWAEPDHGSKNSIQTRPKSGRAGLELINSKSYRDKSNLNLPIGRCFNGDWG